MPPSSPPGKTSFPMPRDTVTAAELRPGNFYCPFTGSQAGYHRLCPGGETGKSGALKRRCPVWGLRVRVPPRALLLIGSLDGGARGADSRPGSEVEGRQPPLHAVGGTPVLHIRRLQGGGDRDRRRAPRADGRLRRRGNREGDAGRGPP